MPRQFKSVASQEILNAFTLNYCDLSTAVLNVWNQCGNITVVGMGFKYCNAYLKPISTTLNIQFCKCFIPLKMNIEKKLGKTIENASD